jgi:carbon-monoxide dehydrogenase large subunit
MTEARTIGASLPRKEDFRLVTGQGRYLDDIAVPNCLHAHFVRSPHAHARIVAIDCKAACAAEGVVAVVTGRELAEWTTPLRMAPPIEGLQPTGFPTLPFDKVRFIGDPIACIVATDRYLAEDAAELIDVAYHALEPVVDLKQALAQDAPLVDDSLSSNLVAHQSFSAGNPARQFAEAEIVVTAEFHQSRQTHAPIETRGCCALWDGGRRHLTMHIGNQVPHPFRTQLARRLRLSESQVTVICPDIGGAFGQKIALYREELTVAALARQLGRPVRWREDRAENLIAASHAREDVARTRVAVNRDGRILALELEIAEDFGAYCFYPANYLARVVAMILTGPYRINDYAFDIKVALTNKCGNGPMRAPMAITSWVMDGTIEAIARRLGRDPVEVRRLNMLLGADLPFTMPSGLVVEDGTEDLRRRRFPRTPGARPRLRHPSRLRHVLRRRVDHLRFRLLQGGRHSRLRSRDGLGENRAFGRDQRLGRSDGLRTRLRDHLRSGSSGAAWRRSRRCLYSSRQHRHRALRHGQPRRPRRHRGRQRAPARRPGAARQGADHRRGIDRP